MTLRNFGGRWFGTIEVLLVRVVDDETQTRIGTTSPFGGIMVERYRDELWAEHPRSWWEREGFTITEPAILEQARQSHRAVTL